VKYFAFIVGLLFVASFATAQKRKGAELVIPRVEVVDKPSFEWVSYPGDTTVVGLTIQTLTCKVKSKLPLQRIEIIVNGLSTDVYTSADLAPAIAQNNYEQHIERTINLRSGSNSVQIIAENVKGIKTEGFRRVIVDPKSISIARNKSDQTPPMVYVSNPSNIRNDMVVVYDDMIKITGTVMDESGVQQVIVNKTVTPVQPNGEFKIIIPLNVGENSIAIEAKDVNQNISLKRFTIERKNADGTVYNPAEAKNYLLVIGINKYNHWPVLNNAVSDATTVSNVLTNQYKFDAGDVTILVDEQATRSNIYSTLRSYIEKVTPRDNLLIYYSGHGYFDKLMSEGYWVPVDGQSNDMSGFIANTQILKIIENINSQHTFLVADACFSGSLFASTSRGYSDQVEKFKSRWGLASGRLEVVSDGAKGDNSPFAESFIQFLSDNDQQKIPVSDLIQYVKKKVAEKSDQTPIGNPLRAVGDEGGEFVFYKKEK
jgi:hypothetical protein